MRNFNVNLTFTANTQQAKTQMKDLQQTLTQLGSRSDVFGPGMQKGLIGVKSTIDQVKIAFQQATDPSTGQININTLRNSMQAFGLSVSKVKADFGALGLEGQVAFMKMKSAVQNAQMPLQRTDTILTKMWTTLKNTARWQMSSAALMAVVTTFSKAMTYAKDLNESLNNIRIVTGYSTEQMDKFAKSANKAAKALSVSTTAFTDAALIYYQQGLADEEVLKRAEVTVKLANVVGESAKTVSEWMTAVWNNFDDGSKSLEYYADVMAALGAATASSADEIAQGLEKFAAIANTVGLSYEYATAALTTVTAQTRQSADVVGTAFKTMFARMQDLELGKTLEDGTSLGQYAETLDKVGVKVLDASGELRAMDAVLNDLGARWDELSNAEQVAVAQGVAGIRQYSQMLALMDNWDVFKDNLGVASTAEGTLDTQAEIYAESWEAASKRAKAAAEGIFDSLLEDDFFIGLTNVLADLLEGIEFLADAMGGLPGILALVTAAMTRAFGPQMLTGLTNFKGMMTELNGQSAALNTTFKENWAKQTYGFDHDLQQQAPNTHNAIQATQGAQSQLDAKVQNLPYKLSPEAEAGYKSLRTSIEQLGDQYIQFAAEADTATQQLNEQSSATAALENATKEATIAEQEVATAKQKLIDKGINVSEVLKRGKTDVESLTAEEREYYTIVENLAQANAKKEAAQNRANKANQEASGAVERQRNATANMTQTQEQYNTAVGKANKLLNQQYKQMQGSQAWMNMASGISSVSFAISSLSSALSVLNNEDMTWGEKLLSIITSLSMTLPMLIMAFKSLNKETWIGVAASTKSIFVKLGQAIPANRAEAKARREVARAAKAEARATREAMFADKAESKSSIKNAAANKIQGASKSGKTQYFQKDGQWFTKNVKTGKTAKYTGKLNASGAPTQMIPGTGGGAGAGAAVLAIGAIVAGIALAVGAVKLFQKEYNKAENAAKEAAKHAKIMREEYTKVTEETKKMQEAFSAYDDAINKTRQLAKGTLEYKQALMEANEKAWDLINTYGLTTSDYKIVNGEVIISDEAQTRALEEQMNEQRKAQMASAQAQTNANSARIKANKVAAARKVDINDGQQEAEQATYGAVSGMGSGALVGAGIGSFFGPLGTAIGAGIGALVGGIAGGIAAGTQDAASKTETKLIDELTERALNNEDLSVDRLQSSIDALKDATDAEVEALINAAQSNAKLVQANEALYDQIGLQIAEMRGIESEQSGVVGNWATEADKKMDPLYNTLLEQLDDNDEQLKNLYELYNEGTLDHMIGDDISVRDKNGKLVGGDNAFKQRDIAKQTIEKMRADIEANPDDYKVGSEKYNKLIAIAGSGNGGFAAMIQPILREYGLLTAKLEQDLAMSRGRAQELNNFDIFKDNEAAKTAFLDQMDAVNRGQKERINLADAGLSWQDIEELEKDLYANWDHYDDTNVQLEQAIKNYAEDIKTVVKEANDAFDVDTILANQEASAQALAGIDAQVFATYVDSLENATSTTEEFATELAKVNLTLESSVKSLNKNFKQYGKAFAKGDKTTLEWSQGVTAIKKDLSNMFEGFEPDTAFTEALISSGQLSKLLDSENVEQDFLALLEQVTNAMIQNADVPEKLEATLQSEFSRLKAEDLTQGTLLSSTGFNFDIFRNAAKDGDLDLQQFIQILQAQGFRYTGDIEKLKEDGNLDYSSFEAEDFEFIGLGTANLIELIEELNEEIDIDRYHDLEEALKDLSEATTYYGKVREKLYNESDSWWNKELANARENIRLLEQYRDRAEGHIQADYNAMIIEASKVGAKIELDDDKRIKNYVDLQSNFGADADFMNALKKYEDSLNTYEAKNYELAEAKLEYLDQSIAKVTEETEKLTALTADSMKMLEFQFEHLGDSAEDTIDRIQNLGKQMEFTFVNKGYYEQSLKDYFLNYSQLVKQKDGSYKKQAIFNEDDYEKLLAGDLSFLKNQPITEDFVKGLRSMRDGLMDTYKSLDGFKEKIQEEIINGYEKWNEKFEDNSKALEHNMKVLKGYRNVIDLLGKDMLGIDDTILAQASAAAVNIATTQMKGAKEQFDFAKAALDKAKLNPELLDDEAMKKLEDSYREAELGLTETLAASVEAINTEFENSLNAIMDNFDQAVGGIFGSLDEVQEWFDKYEELEDFYLKPYEKVYEINTLNREIQDAIQNSDNLKYQRELNELSSELLGYQEEGVEMSDQDLEYMQKRFEVMKAQAAFEEAQNAKKEVRLTRDSQGNYSYVYTANEEAVNKAQADLDKSVYELEKHFDEVQSSLSSMYLKTTKEYADAVAALDKTSETYEQDLQRVTDFYSQRLSQIEGEISESLIRAAKANEDYGARAKTAFNELVIGQMYTDVKSFSDLHNEVFLPNIQSVIEQATSTYNTWKTNVDTVFGEAGVSVEEFGKLYAEVIGNKDKGTGIEGKTNSLATSLEGLGSSAKAGFEGIVNTAAANFTEFDKQITEYKTALDGLLPKLNEFLEKAGLAKDAQVPNPGDGPPPVDDSDQWKVTGYARIKDGQGGWTHGLKVENLNDSSKNKIIAAGDIDTFKNIDSGTAFASHKEANEIHKESGSIGKAIADAASQEAWSPKDMTLDSHKGQIVSDLGVYKTIDGIRYAAVKVGDKWYDQASLGEYSDDKLQVGQKITIPENSHIVADDSRGISFGGGVVSSIKEYETVKAGDPIVQIDNQGSVPLYKVRDKWYKPNALQLQGGEKEFKEGAIVKIVGQHYPLPINEFETIDFPYGIKQSGEITHYELLDDGVYYQRYEGKAPYWNTSKGVKVVAYRNTNAANSQNERAIQNANLYKFNKTAYLSQMTQSLDYYEHDEEDEGMWPFNWINQTDLHQYLNKVGEEALYKQYRLRKFDTGGYTGSWGPEGRMAMLHQKEIVLNAHDTENFLTAVQIVRSMADKLELSARAAQQGLGTLVHASTIPGERGTLEQNVTIHAEFPNATNHSEIEEAFRNLATTAIQFARPRI